MGTRDEVKEEGAEWVGEKGGVIKGGEENESLRTLPVGLALVLETGKRTTFISNTFNPLLTYFFHLIGT